MSTIMQLPPADLDRFTEIVVNAYPGMNVHSAADKQQFTERLKQQSEADPTTRLFGLYRNDQLLGGMRLFDFTVNLLQTQVAAGGVGLVAVDLLHKKEHVAKELIESFVRQYRERGVSMAMLYPFRPDFYKQMGFGYGTRLNQYRVAPAGFPRSTAKADVRYLVPDDAPALLECYTRFFERTHGMIARKKLNFERLFHTPENRLVGVVIDGRIEAYALFTFKAARQDNWLINDLVISEWVATSQVGLAQLLSFLHTQADQIRHVVINTQDDYFHYVLRDPRNGSGNVVALHHETNTQNLGLMYRVIDVPGIFRDLAAHRFGDVSCTIKLSIEDSFLPENAGSTIVQFEDGYARVVASAAYDVELRLDVANFSSLLVGAVPFDSLYRFGLAELSDPQYVSRLDALFRASKPICMTQF